MLKEKQRVMVVDTCNKRYFPAILWNHSVSVLGEETKKFSEVTPIKDEMPEALQSEYSDILYVYSSCVYDYDAFKDGKADLTNLVTPKYNLGDDIFGFATPANNINKEKLTPRLVGGEILATEICVPIVENGVFFPRIKYYVSVDLSYSIEQLRREHMRKDKTYRVKKGTYVAIVYEDLAIDVHKSLDFHNYYKNNKATNFMEADGFFLFYTMATILMIAQLRQLTPSAIGRVVEEILSRTNLMFHRGENIDTYGNTIRRLSSPSPVMMDTILKSASHILSNNLKDDRTVSYFDEFFLDKLVCEGLFTIPIKRIVHEYSNHFLSEDLTGINFEDFVKYVLIGFVYKKTDLTKHPVSNATIEDLVDQLFSCIKSPFKVGSIVKIRMGGLTNDAIRGLMDDPTYPMEWEEFMYQDDFDIINQITRAEKFDDRFVVTDLGPGGGEICTLPCCTLRRTTSTHEEDRIIIPIDLCVIDGDDVEQMNTIIYTSVINYGDKDVNQ